VNSLKAKVTLLVLALATLAAIPTSLRADGNPFPTCGVQGTCVASN